MRNRFPIVVFLLIVLAAASASGQSAISTWNVNVPFKFMVGQKEMPAGEYQFRKEPSSSYISMRGSESKQSVNLPVITRLARMDSKQNAGARLVFDTAGGKKSLSEVWPQGTEDGYLVSAKKGKHGHDIVKEE